jgi:hypothetical protein
MWSIISSFFIFVEPQSGSGTPSVVLRRFHIAPKSSKSDHRSACARTGLFDGTILPLHACHFGPFDKTHPLRNLQRPCLVPVENPRHTELPPSKLSWHGMDASSLTDSETIDSTVPGCKYIRFPGLKMHVSHIRFWTWTLPLRNMLNRAIRNTIPKAPAIQPCTAARLATTDAKPKRRSARSLLNRQKGPSGRGGQY